MKTKQKSIMTSRSHHFIFIWNNIKKKHSSRRQHNMLIKIFNLFRFFMFESFCVHILNGFVLLFS